MNSQGTCGDEFQLTIQATPQNVVDRDLNCRAKSHPRLRSPTRIGSIHSPIFRLLHSCFPRVAEPNLSTEALVSRTSHSFLLSAVLEAKIALSQEPGFTRL